MYHARYESICRTIIAFAREYKTQVFMSTHNDEWLKSFVRAAGENLSDIAFIRIEHGKGSHTATQFDGDDLAAGMEWERRYARCPGVNSSTYRISSCAKAQKTRRFYMRLGLSTIFQIATFGTQVDGMPLKEETQSSVVH